MKRRILNSVVLIAALLAVVSLAVCYFDNPRNNPYDLSNGNPVLMQLARILASDGAADDCFGASVSASSDGSVIVVGAYSDDPGGSAYVFTESGGTWIQTAKLTASDGAADDYFGISVSVSSDGSVIVVGSYPDDPGSAYVFVKPVGGWADKTEDAKLTASDGETGDYFGVGVSVSSDGSVIVVGDFSDDFWGSAYLFGYGYE